MNRAQSATRNLEWLLRPMQSLLDDPALTDLYINGAGEDLAFVDRGRGKEQITLPYTLDDLDDIAINAASLTGQDIAEDVPLVSTKFPGGHRVQIVRSPAVPEGTISFSVRRPSMKTATPADLERFGVFDKTVGRQRRVPKRQAELVELYRDKKWLTFLELAVASGLNIVFAGPVGAGKTFNMRSFVHCIPHMARIVTVEDMQELIALAHPDVVNLLYSKGRQSVANVQADDLVEAALRMGMDALLVQELRDQAAYSFLTVLESGHHGMTTTHSESAEQTYDRVCTLVKKHPQGMHLNSDDVLKSLYRSIDVVVYCVKDGNSRHIEQILYDPSMKERYANHNSPFGAMEAA